MEITIVNESKHAVPRKFIQTWMDEMARHLMRKKVLKAKDAKKDITLVFLDKKAAQKINKQFRGKDYATDVLSFDSMEPTSLGELILCPDVLKKQAQEHDLTYQQELGYMLLHGVLHLLGYDHETGEADAKKMFKIQDEAFEHLLG
ncbi:Endoribonuclease YbeY [compost metagenome]